MNTLYYQRQGAGTPVVLLHGFCETLAVWEAIIPELSKSNQVIALDLPGFGGSDHLQAPTSLKQVAIQVHSFLQSLHIKKYVIIGHSLGGYISLELAKLYPESILGIGMIHSTAFSDNLEKKNIRKKTIDFVRKNGVSAFIKSFVPQLFADKKSPYIKVLIDMAKKTPEKSLINYTIAMMERKDYGLILKNWVNPLIFIAGEKDEIVPIDRSRKHLQYVPENCFFELSEVGHLGMYEASQKVVNLLIKYVYTISK